MAKNAVIREGKKKRTDRLRRRKMNKELRVSIYGQILGVLIPYRASRDDDVCMQNTVAIACHQYRLVRKFVFRSHVAQADHRKPQAFTRTVPTGTTTGLAVRGHRRRYT